jgi:hypothetical protein
VEVLWPAPKVNHHLSLLMLQMCVMGHSDSFEAEIEVQWHVTTIWYIMYDFTSGL